MTQISREIFEQQRRPRFGNANPERMNYAFWEWMIRGEEIAPTASKGSLGQVGMKMREGKLKSAYGPHRARDLFNVQMNREDGPIWTFERYGATRTELEDGRIVCIGGEHEDYYDPDFHIYNDLIVLVPDGQIEIYCYPKEVFPPTDFHTATAVGGEIIIIGCLGNVAERRPGFTPVYSVDMKNYRISQVTASGTAPGWISKHAADLSNNSVINLRGGQIVELMDGRQNLKRNNELFSLDIKGGIWAQTTDRNWPHWSIRQEDRGMFLLDHAIGVHDLVPQGVERIVPKEESRGEVRFLFRGVPIRVIAGVRCIEIVAEGELPEELCRKVPEVFRRRVEALSKKKCVVE